LLASHPISPPTINHRMKFIVTLFQFARCYGSLPENRNFHAQ